MIHVDIEKDFQSFKLMSKFVGDDDRIGILGASGCGKSMTLKAIAGIITPDKGRILVNDQVYFDSEKKINIPPQKRNIGYLFQNYALFPTMTVEKNIAAGLGGRKPEEIKERVAIMIKKFALKGLEKRYPKELSGGQQQRVALARIMAYEPEVLMLDEPFSALDSFLKDNLKMEMKHLLDEYEGGMIMVSHSRDEIYEFTNQLLLMDQGLMIETGKTRDLFAKPYRMETARLTGCKNLSVITRLDENHVYAKEWGITLETVDKVHDNITHVGIRSHHIKLSEKEQVNSFPFDLLEQSETPFEYKYIVKKSESNHSHMWWQVPKNKKNIFTRQRGGYLHIQPEDVMLLSSK